jgi:ferredoxin-thioredoxin reductase catalytic chain
MDQPSEKNIMKMRNFVEKFAAKSGTYLHPDRTVTDVVVEGLARHIEEVGKPLRAGATEEVEEAAEE